MLGFCFDFLFKCSIVCLFFTFSFLFTSSSLDTSVHLFLVLVFYFFGVHFFIVFSFSSKIKVFFPLIYQVEMLAIEVKNLHQNKIYLVQFALQQIKTSDFLLYLDSPSCENLPPKQCCPGLLYASFSSFFSFFLLIFFFGGLVLLLFEIYFFFFCIEFPLFVHFFFFFIHISFLWYIYIFNPLFFFS